VLCYLPHNLFFLNGRLVHLAYRCFHFCQKEALEKANFSVISLRFSFSATLDILTLSCQYSILANL
jgi:hypothetical protein